MTIRLSVVLLGVLLFSALYLVRIQFDSRHLVTEIEHARAQGKALVSERTRLEVQRRAQSTTLRVERLAADGLDMRPITPAITEYVAYTPVRGGGEP